jgi:hypothetical protein
VDLFYIGTATVLIIVLVYLLKKHPLICNFPKKQILKNFKLQTYKNMWQNCKVAYVGFYVFSSFWSKFGFPTLSLKQVQIFDWIVSDKQVKLVGYIV